ncbi:MAG: carboxymuconolactone decarboxylase family protein [Solimonas sp.]
MSSHYHDPADLAQLKRLRELAPTEFEAWLQLDKIVGRDDGAIPRKYRELMAVAVALTTQCPYCIEVHARAARRAGASPAELSETTFITAALRAGAAATHGAMAMKLYGEEPQPAA